MSRVDPGEVASRYDDRRTIADVDAVDDGAEAAERVHEFFEAIRSIDIIGQAKGVMMVTRQISAAEALVTLRWEALRDSVSLLHVASAVVIAAETRAVRPWTDDPNPTGSADDRGSHAATGRWPWRRA